MPDETGWSFTGTSGSTGDALYHQDFLWQIYALADPHYSGRVTVPVLWDKERKTIVNNESAEIIRMLNSAFDGLTGNDDDYYPPGAPRNYRRHQRPRLRHRQQRCL